jgi:hypothetical protein
MTSKGQRERGLHMANHTITLPIIKSSNDFGYRALTDVYWDTYYNRLEYVFTDPVAVSNTLDVAYKSSSAYRMGLAWDESQVPKGKEIKNATLHYYTTHGHSKPISYKYASFNEGSSIPSHEPSDGVKAGGASSGWGEIDLGKPKGNSVILYAALGPAKLYFYDGVREDYVNGAEAWKIYSHRNATNQPYVVITYGDVPPELPTSLYPNGAIVSNRDVIRFSWVHNSLAGVLQKGFELQYSLNSGGTWTTVSQVTTNQYYDMPANTLPTSGTVTWRVRTTDANDETSEFTTANFTIGIPPQKAPVPISPISQYADEKLPIRFEWIFSGGSASDTQSKVDLQYSTDGGSTWITVTRSITDNYMILNAGIVTKGNIVWRVRTYNQWGDISPYSDVKSFTVIGSPATPLITEISNKARPTIKWQTSEQHLYELEILLDNEVIYRTGIIPNTTEKEHQIPIYLDNGEYTARLRITNEYNLSSSWAEKYFAIDIAKPNKPDITVYNGSFGVTIKTDTALKSFVYRDNEYLGEMLDGTYKDYTGANDKDYRYFIRVIDSNDSYADSDTKMGRCRLPSNTISLLDKPGDYVKLEYGLDGTPKKDSTFSINATTQHYDGRAYPIVEYSEFRTFEKTLSFHLDNKADVDKLKNLINQNKTLIYRDTDGEVVIGNAITLDYSKSLLGYTVGFTITRTV